MRLLIAVLVLAGAAVFVVVFTRPVRMAGQYLVIRDSVSGRLYGRQPLQEGGEFSIEFVHSVNNSPVRETFRAADGRIEIVSVRFFAFGAGMASDLEEGQHISRDGDALVISGFTRPPLVELRYIVGTVSDHLLMINGETISLRDLCGRNAAVTVLIK